MVSKSQYLLFGVIPSSNKPKLLQLPVGLPCHCRLKTKCWCQPDTAFLITGKTCSFLGVWTPLQNSLCAQEHYHWFMNILRRHQQKTVLPIYLYFTPYPKRHLLKSKRSQRVGHEWMTKQQRERRPSNQVQQRLSCKLQIYQCSCLAQNCKPSMK